MQSGKLDEPLRVVVDESSFAFHDLDDPVIEEAIDDFNDLLSHMLQAGIPVSKFSLCFEFECRTGVPLYSLLYERAAGVDVDTRHRCGALLDRCIDWDEGVDDVVTGCEVMGESLDSWSLGYAVIRSSDHLMACVGCSTAGRLGLLAVTAGGLSAELFFLVRTSGVVDYWQSVLSREVVDSRSFFLVASRAFPRLVFHSDLDFRKFHGEYEEVYGWVVRVFIALNNYIFDSYESRKGVRHLIQSDLASRGIEISPESGQTHKNRRAISQRVIEYDGFRYSCEWHAKRLWNTDRIHFTTPGSLPGGRILVALFVKHLDT